MLKGAVLATVSAVALSGAPLQCGSRGSEDPALRREETAGDALWALAEDFHARGDARAAEHTLRTLVEKYPSSRYARAAKEQLEADASTR